MSTSMHLFSNYSGSSFILYVSFYTYPGLSLTVHFFLHRRSLFLFYLYFIIYNSCFMVYGFGYEF